MRGRYFLPFFGVLLAASAAATFLHVPIVAALETEIVSHFVENDLPLADPTSEMWNRATPSDVPLSGQAVLAPMNPQPSVNSMRIRSLNNGEWIAFLLEWDDATKDVGGGPLDYKDSAAIQFPSREGEPFYCMGMSGGLVEILHWRSDFQRDIEVGLPNAKDLFPNMWSNAYSADDAATFQTGQAAGNPLSLVDKTTPVEDLYAVGAGTLEAQPQNDAVGWAQWSDGTWKAVLGRPMSTVDGENVQFRGGVETSLALAAWDGAKGEINGKKSVSTWLTFRVDGAPEQTVPGLSIESPFWLNPVSFVAAGIVALVIISGGVLWVVTRNRN